MLFDGMQAYKVGLVEYARDPWNLVDQAHIWVGIANALAQRFSADALSPLNAGLMVAVALFMLIKTFFFLRLFTSLSFLVSMLRQVSIDLVPFFLFYMLLLLTFALILGVIDWGQYEYSDDAATRGAQFTSTGPDKEYMRLHKIAARLFHVMRLSVGDFDFAAATYLEPY
jgi:hypothetical protein